MNKISSKYLYVLVAILTVVMSPMFIDPIYASESDAVQKSIDAKTAKQLRKELKTKINQAEDALDEADDFYKAQSKKLGKYKKELAYYQEKSKSFDKNTNPKKVKEVNNEISKYTSLTQSQGKTVDLAKANVLEATTILKNAETELQKFDAEQESSVKAQEEALKKAEAEYKAKIKKALENKKAETRADKEARKQEMLADKKERDQKKEEYAAKKLIGEKQIEINKAIRDDKEKQTRAYVSAERAWLLYNAAKKDFEKVKKSNNKEEITKAQNKLIELEKDLEQKVAEYRKFNNAIAHDAYEKFFADVANAQDDAAFTDVKKVYDEYHNAYVSYTSIDTPNADKDQIKKNLDLLEKKLEEKIEEYKKYNPAINLLIYEKTLSGDPQNTLQQLDEAQKNLDQANHDFISHLGKLPYRVLPLSDSTNVISKVQEKTGLKFKPAHRQSDLDYFAALEINEQRLISQFEVINQWNINDDLVNKVIALTKQRAIDAGFYLIGIDYAKEKNTIFVDMGHIGEVKVVFGTNTQDGFVKKPAAGTTLFTEKQIKNRFGQGRKTEPVQNGEVFNFNTIQDRFYDLNAHPDIKRADIRFSPNTDVANRALDITLNVEENDSLLAPAHFVFGVDNFGSMEGTDEWMARGTVQFLNLWQCDHALTVNGNYSLGGSLYGVAGSYYIPRLENGRLLDLAWTFHGGYTDVDTEDVVPAIDVEGKGYFGGVQVSKRIVDSRDYSLDISLGLTYRYVDSALVIDGQKWEMGKDGDGYEIMPLSLAIIYTGKSLDSFGGRNYATIEGIHNVGGSSLEEMQYYRATIDDEAYTLIRAQVARIQLLDEVDKMTSGSWMLFAKLDSQFADGPLNGAEQFGLGGHGSVRGYEERQFMADSGVAGTLEIRTPLILGIIDRFPNDSLPWDRMQFVGFFDYGWYNLEDGLGEGDDDSEFICSVGLGLRFAGSENAQLRFDWGIPLIKDDEKFETDSAGRIHLSMQVQF